MYDRKQTKKVNVGGVTIGGGAPISVQSMTNASPSDTEALAKQVGELAAAGCDIVRMTVPDDAAVRSLAAVKERFPGVPVVADIHFSSRLAVESVAAAT